MAIGSQIAMIKPLEFPVLDESATEASGETCLATLRRSARFSHLSADLLGALAMTASRATFERDAVIVYENEPGVALYLVVSGGVKRVKTGADGREFIIALVGPGRSFGEQSIFDPHGQASTAIAMLDTTLVRLDGRRFRDLTLHTPELALTVLEGLSESLRRKTEHLQGLALEQVEQRLARLLVELMGDFGRPVVDGTQMRVRLTRQMLADMIGATVETTIRIMSRWTKERLIVTTHHEILILDCTRIEALTQLTRT